MQQSLNQQIEDKKKTLFEKREQLAKLKQRIELEKLAN